MDTELQELGNNGQGREKQEVESLLRQENEKNIPVVDE